MIRVLIADDDALFRVGVSLILAEDPEIEVVGVAHDGREAVDQVRSARGDIDVVLMDADMPGLDGVEATREIVRSTTDRPRVLVLTTFTRDEYLQEAITAGASGFLLKDTVPEALVQAIASVHQGTAVVSPELTVRLVESGPARPPADSAQLDLLTAREREILGLIGAGLNNSEICAELFIAEVTVKTHVGHVLRKLRVRDRVQAVVLAHRLGAVAQLPSGD